MHPLLLINMMTAKALKLMQEPEPMEDVDFPDLATAMDEIRYLRGLVLELRARVAELEAAGAITLGTLEPPTDDEPARYTHNVPPSAPPHDE
jgi:hypothetical protein